MSLMYDIERLPVYVYSFDLCNDACTRLLLKYSFELQDNRYFFNIKLIRKEKKIKKKYHYFFFFY